MSWLSKLLDKLPWIESQGKAILRELGELSYFVARERYLASILAAYGAEPALAGLSSEQKRAAASIALEVVRRKLLGE